MNKQYVINSLLVINVAIFYLFKLFWQEFVMPYERAAAYFRTSTKPYQQRI